jgi:hypothetical protein
MIPVQTRHPPGTVGIGTGDLARYTTFAHALARLQVPVGSALAWITGPSIARNHNELVRVMEGDWLWILADDHDFEPESLIRLLDRDVDCVVPLVTTRQPPYTMVVYDKQMSESEYLPLAWTDLPASGALVPIRTAGTAGMLVRKPALGRLSAPYFVPQGPAGLSEDWAFCEALQAAGVSIHLDPSVWFGHTTPVTIWPTCREGRWGVRLALSQTASAEMFP